MIQRCRIILASPTKRHKSPTVRTQRRSLWRAAQAERLHYTDLILFDIANKEVLTASDTFSFGSFSPNTIRTRLALHYKGLPYTQSWISYPDIELLWKQLNIPPNTLRSKTAPSCTLPVLLLRAEAYPPASLRRLREMQVPGLQEAVHTKHGVFTPIASTLGIALALDILFRHLDQCPRLFPDHQSLEKSDQVQSIITRLMPIARRLVIPSVPKILDDRGREYFIDTRKKWFNVASLEQLRPQFQEEEDQLWQEMEAILQPVIHTLRQSPLQEGPMLDDRLGNDDQDQPYADSSRSGCYLSGGSEPIYADFILMAFLAWTARVDTNVFARLTQNVGGGILEEFWIGCLPYLRPCHFPWTMSWFEAGSMPQK